jgi:hypothetical protein
MSIFYVLIYIFSLTLQSLVSLNIHNQCQNISLTSPVYFIRGGKWRVAPDREIDVNAVMQNHIEFDAGQDILEGFLAYRIQRKHADSNQSELKRIWLLVALHGDQTKGLHVHALVVEHNKRFDKDRLKRLYKKHRYLLKTRANITKSNWVLDDTTMLTTFEIMNGGDRWDIFISEEKK